MRYNAKNCHVLLHGQYLSQILVTTTGFEL